MLAAQCWAWLLGAARAAPSYRARVLQTRARAVQSRARVDTSARAVCRAARAWTRPRARCPDPRAHGPVRALAWPRQRARMDPSARVGRWGRAWSRVALLCLLVHIFFGLPS